MTMCWIFTVFMFLMLCKVSEQTEWKLDIGNVKVDGTERDDYGTLLVEVNQEWSPVCDTHFHQNVSTVACRQLNYKDGRYFTGSTIDGLSPPSFPFAIQCNGMENRLDECNFVPIHNCSSQTYVTLYCSKEIIKDKDSFKVRIAGDTSKTKHLYGALEVNRCGHWGPVCHLNWTNLEANAACKQLGYSGGVAQYSTLPDPVPVLFGLFSCGFRATSLDDCWYRGFGQDIGCQHTIEEDQKFQVAGVLCYNNDDGVQFRLSHQWYGEVQVSYNGTWGSVCNTDWDVYDSKVLCNQLGYKDGRPNYDFISTNTSRGYMDNVYCTGSEGSILSCDHSPRWTAPDRECSSAYVTCDKTVCGDIDIRHESHLSRLKYCNIIEGNLTMLFIDTVTWEGFTHYACPGLVEITDYLLLFRVYNLRSLNVLFPNLAIIRGDVVFTEYYSLFVFEMPDLRELGLNNLVTIGNGSVRLEKNPSLCYIETIDWEALGADIAAENNRAVRECWNQCPSQCNRTLAGDKLVPRCWNTKSCQKLPVSACPAGVDHDGRCCNRSCVAGCTGPTSQQCTACKHVTYQNNSDQPTCLNECPAGTYMFRNRRCLKDYECKDMVNRSKNFRATTEVYNNLKLVTLPDANNRVQRLCVKECPEGFQIDPNDPYRCVPCQGKCPKVRYKDLVIDTILDATIIKGYSKIVGSLEIKLMHGDQISTILEENLADLEEVTGYVKIQYSYALLTLHFLKNLRRIGGEVTYNGYILFVFNNINLQELFLEDVTRNMYLGPGKVFFHSNRKLCHNKISHYLTSVGRNMASISKDDVSMATNGDQIPCEIQKLNVSIFRKGATNVIISWDLMTAIADERRLLGYMLYWKETSGESLSTFEGRDACSEDKWESIMACQEEPNFCNSDRGAEMMRNLKPWTKYAMYVKAITVSSSTQGAISDVIYFKTNVDAPTTPMNVEVQSELPGQLLVTWDPPTTLNGDNNTLYWVEWKYKQLDIEMIETRDYCLNPLTSNVITKRDDVKDILKENKTIDDNCCCPKTGKDFEEEERKRKLAIDFHDFLQNSIYTKSTSYPVVVKSSVANETFLTSKLAKNQSGKNTTTDETEVSPVETPSHTSLTVLGSDYNVDMIKEREFRIKDLGYFTHINVEVKACNKDPNAAELLCSQQAIIFTRTLADDNADSINSSLITWRLASNKTGSVYVNWHEPEKPNGLVLAYDLQVQNLNIAAKPMVICITAKAFRQMGKRHELEKLSPGNYSLKIRAISLAGNGSWSEDVYFQIPYQPYVKPLINITVVILICVAVTIVLVITIVIWCFYKRRKSREDMMFSTNPDYCQSYYVYTPDEWEIDRDKVFIVRELGHGSFGMVYEGYVWDDIDKKSEGQKIPVAIKTTNANSSEHDRYQFLQEASIMKKFCCHHVVKLIGVVSKEQPAYVLMELMPRGDLKSFLRIRRPDCEDSLPPPTLSRFLQMAGEIADGMAYLADNKFVHRDLAARNCMVAEDLTVKIGDFGMTRDIYEHDYYRKGSRGLLPVRWMPPEALHDGVFTSMTDVWSYGVVLWEMATLAEQPYQGLSHEEVMTYVLSGKIMDSPVGCPARLYDLMVKCWRFRPKQRPTFKEIIELLLPDLNAKFEEVSYFFSEEHKRHLEALEIKALENESVENVNEVGGVSDEDNDDGYSDSPMNDYMEEVLPMLSGAGADGPIDSGVLSHANDQQSVGGGGGGDGGVHDNYDPNIPYSQANCDINADDSVHSLLNNTLNNTVKYPYANINSEPNNRYTGNVENTDTSFHPSLKETSLVNGHIQPDIRTSIC